MTKIRNTIAYIQTIKIAKSELQSSDHINKGKDKGSALFIPDYKIVIGFIISDNMIEINKHMGIENLMIARQQRLILRNQRETLMSTLNNTTAST